MILFGGTGNIFLFQQTISNYLSNTLHNRNPLLLSQNTDIISLGASYYQVLLEKSWNYMLIDNTNSDISQNIEQFKGLPVDMMLKANIENLRKEVNVKECQYQMLVEKKNELSNLVYIILLLYFNNSQTYQRTLSLYPYSNQKSQLLTMLDNQRNKLNTETYLHNNSIENIQMIINNVNKEYAKYKSEHTYQNMLPPQSPVVSSDLLTTATSTLRNFLFLYSSHGALFSKISIPSTMYMPNSLEFINNEYLQGIDSSKLYAITIDMNSVLSVMNVYNLSIILILFIFNSK